MARPKKNRDEARGAALSCYPTAVEKRQIMAAAAAAEMPVSRFLLSAALSRGAPTIRTVRRDEVIAAIRSASASLDVLAQHTRGHSAADALAETVALLSIERQLARIGMSDRSTAYVGEPLADATPGGRDDALDGPLREGKPC